MTCFISMLGENFRAVTIWNFIVKASTEKCSGINQIIVVRQYISWLHVPRNKNIFTSKFNRISKMSSLRFILTFKCAWFAHIKRDKIQYSNYLQKVTTYLIVQNYLKIFRLFSTSLHYKYNSFSTRYTLKSFVVFLLHLFINVY